MQKSLFWDLKLACFITTVHVVGRWNAKSVQLMQCTLQKDALGILHFVKEKEKSPIKYQGRANKKNAFSNLKWSRVISSSWTSTAVWCQQNWAEACGLWASCCRRVTTSRWRSLWMGCAGQTAVQTCRLFGSRIRTLPQVETSATWHRAVL